MNIEMCVLNDGRITLICDKPTPDAVRRVEFYREERLFQFVYNDVSLDDHMMECRIPEHLLEPIEKNPNVIILTIVDGFDPIGYKAPLIKVGELY